MSQYDPRTLPLAFAPDTLLANGQTYRKRPRDTGGWTNPETGQFIPFQAPGTEIYVPVEPVASSRRNPATSLADQLGIGRRQGLKRFAASGRHKAARRGR